MHGTVLMDGIAAGAVAAVVSGAPSTLWALAVGRDPLEPTLAAGSLLLPRESRQGRLFAAAVPVHLAVSIGWALILSSVLPRRRTTRPRPRSSMGGAEVIRRAWGSGRS